MNPYSELAINGGSKTRIKPWPTRRHFGLEEKNAAMALFNESISTGNAFGYNGPQEEAYCREFADFMGGGYADGVNSGTNSVYIALRALDPPPFSEVIVSAVTDPGGIMPIPLLNCIPVIADTAPDSFNSGAEQIEAVITERTSAIIIAHISGEPADMNGIMEVARQYNIPVVEDCSQAHATSLNEQLVGTFGDVAAFSLMFGKHCCVGGQGGMVFTKSEEIYWKIRRAADRGKPFALDESKGNVHASLNCNMDELHAAIGRVQLNKLPDIVSRRRAFIELLRRKGLFELESVSLPKTLPGAGHSYWWCRLEYDGNFLSCSKKEYIDALMSEGLLVSLDYRGAMPFTQQWFLERANQHPWNNPLCEGNPCRDFPTPNCEAVMDKNFNLVVYESWGESEADDIVAAFCKVEKAFTK